MVSSRKYLQTNLWADDIKERDEHKCVICGSKDFLQVHHIYGIKDYGFLFSDTSNGVTLCMDCHNLYHHLYPDEVNPYTWTQFLLNNQWNTTSIKIEYNNGFEQVIPIYNNRKLISKHKMLINNSVRNTVIHAVQTSGFDNGITPIEWVKLYVNQVYGVDVDKIMEEIEILINKKCFEKIGKYNVRFKV